MADTMLPEGETLIREILVGKRYAKEKFGVDVPVMWQADSFGLNAQLPQIYKKSGYRYVALRRGATKRKPSEFLWEALDGTDRKSTRLNSSHGYNSYAVFSLKKTTTSR